MKLAKKAMMAASGALLSVAATVPAYAYDYSAHWTEIQTEANNALTAGIPIAVTVFIAFVILRVFKRVGNKV